MHCQPNAGARASSACWCEHALIATLDIWPGTTQLQIARTKAALHCTTGSTTVVIAVAFAVVAGWTLLSRS
jgi:hypothetical protein